MSAVTLKLEKEIVDLLNFSPQPVEDVLKEYVVLELYRRAEISSGKAAELLNMGRFEFIRYASRLGIPFFDMDERELAEELENLKNLP